MANMYVEAIRRLRSRERSHSRTRNDTDRNITAISRKQSRTESGAHHEDTVIRDQGHSERSRSRDRRTDDRRRSGQKETLPSLIASLAEPVASAAIKLIGEQFTTATGTKNGANAQRNEDSKPAHHSSVEEEHVESRLPARSSKKPVIVVNPPPQQGQRVAFEFQGEDTSRKEGKSKEQQQSLLHSQQDYPADDTTHVNSRDYIRREIDELRREINSMRREADAYQRGREEQRGVDLENRFADLRRQEAEAKKRAEEQQRNADRLKKSTKVTNQESKAQEESGSDDQFSKEDWRKLETLLSNAQQTYARWSVKRNSRVPGQPESADGRSDEKFQRKVENL